MKSLRRLFAWHLSVVALAGCEPRENATLCVFSANEAGSSDPGAFSCPVDASAEDVSPGAEEARALVRCPSPTAGEWDLIESSAYFLRHELPEGLVSVGALQIRLETPCESAARDLTAKHLDGRVLLSFTPPRGARCALRVTATMAQSELSCDLLRPAPPPDISDPCADLEALCAEEAEEANR